MGDALDNSNFGEVIGPEAQASAGTGGRRLRTGEPGDAGFHVAGDLDPAGRFFARIALERAEGLGRLIAYLRKQRGITPGSLLGKALAYAAGQWPHLEPCFIDGQIEFDNNLTENAIRPSKLGMKNWMCVSRKEVMDVERAA